MDELQSLKELASRYTRLTDLSFDAIVIYAEDTRIRFINESGLAILKATADQVVGQPISRFVLPEYWDTLKQRMEYMFKEGRQTSPTEICVRNLAGEIVDAEATGIAIPYEGRPAVLAILRDISMRKQYERGIEHLAHHDEMTGLPNRRWFDQHVFPLMQQCAEADRSAGLLSIDFDFFKHVNDSFGHPFGDLLLQEISRRLLEEVDSRHLAIRMGGDEFMLILLDMENTDELMRWSERILACFRVPFQLMGVPIHSSCSIGMAHFPEHGSSFHKLLKSADIALYQAKLQRDCAVMFEPRMEHSSIRQLAMIDELREALEQGWFVLHYQPQIDLRSGSIRGAEALIRMNHPKKGLLLPEYFIPVAETSSMMIPIGEWVLREACRQNMAWQRQGLRPISISVNVSMRQFHEAAFADKVVRALDDSGMPAELLALEITEGCAADGPKLERVLRALKPLGVRIGIDDFGAGYSSLSQLSQSGIDELKIDRSFIMQMTEHKTSENLVKTIISMARIMQLRVAAEGMETGKQADMLRDWGCDTAQGYFFSKPVPAETLYDKYQFHP